MTNRPFTKIQDGLITATIWKNHKAGGQDFFSVTLSRSYQKDGEWHETKSFAGTDLLKIARLTEAAYSLIQRSKHEAAEPESVG